MLSFTHGGRDEGFDAMLMAFAGSGQGAAIMINANDNSRFFGRVLTYLARMYGWPQASVLRGSAPAVARGVPVDARVLASDAGWYELRENQMIALVPDSAGTGMETLTDGFPDERFPAADSAHFGSDERAVRFAVLTDSAGAVTGLRWRAGPEPADERTVARVAPLPSTRVPVSDPDSALTRRVIAALRIMDLGGSALAQATDIPPGTKRDFAAGTGGALTGLAEPVFLGEEDVAARGIHRHGSDVVRVRYYRVTTRSGATWLLVHLTAEGDVADYDLVDR
jgi:hypothetical protein